jgi:hypothetical protein
MKYLPTRLTRRQCSEAGMAACLVLLLAGLFTGRILFFQLAIPALLINMIMPMFWYPFAVIWYGLAGLMGDVVSRILLSMVYMVLVIPVGLIRKLAGRDSLKLRMFRKSDTSVMIRRDHLYSPADLEKPF